MSATASHCPYCALQCGMTIAGPAPATVTPRAFPTNGGGLCRKGWTSAAVLTAPDRLTTPLMRTQAGTQVPVGWEVALDHIAACVRDARLAHGPDAVAVFGGGGLTNEKAYQLGKFARVALGTRLIDYNGRFCMSSAAAAGNRAFGLDRGLPFPLTDLAGAGAVLLVGSNPAETMPPFVRHLDGARARGGLLVIDPRRSATAALTADGRGRHLGIVPGTDLVLLLGLLHVVLAEGLHDRDYIEDRTTGFERVAVSVSPWWPERVEQVCGIPAHEVRRAARILAAAAPHRGGPGAYILTGRGAEQSTQGTATVTAAIDLALALGLPGRRGSGYGCLTGQGNGQGGREHGQKADQLPGYRSIEDPAAREHVAAVWGVDPATLPRRGVPALDLLHRLGTPGGPRVLFVHGSNLVVSAPNSAVVQERLRALDLLVVSDVVPSETARLADVVLPVTQWAEEEGTMTNLEGRILRRRKALDPPPGVRSELWVWRQLARRLAAPGRWPTSPARVFDELARASAGGIADYSGASHALIDAAEAAGRGVYWPCPPETISTGPTDSDADGTGPTDSDADGTAPTDGDADGTPRLFLDRFPHPDGRARFIAVEPHPPADDVRDDAPLHLVTGRVLAHYQSGAQTRRVPDLRAAAAEPVVEVHPLLADRLGIEPNALVRVTSARGTAYGRAVVTADTRPDTVFMPFHWSGLGSVNRVTSDATDPISGMPDFKVCAVTVEPVAADVPVLEVSV